jgi:hypothetical protein
MNSDQGIVGYSAMEPDWSSGVGFAEVVVLRKIQLQPDQRKPYVNDRRESSRIVRRYRARPAIDGVVNVWIHIDIEPRQYRAHQCAARVALSPKIK